MTEIIVLAKPNSTLKIHVGVLVLDIRFKCYNISVRR